MILYYILLYLMILYQFIWSSVESYDTFRLYNIELCDTISYHKIQYHFNRKNIICHYYVISYNTILYHILDTILYMIQYHIICNNIESYINMILYHDIMYHDMILFYMILYHIYHVISWYNIISYIIWYEILSFNMILFYYLLYVWYCNTWNDNVLVSWYDK